MSLQEVKIQREKYRPEEVRYLFIAEAPPCTEGQFFYFENLTKGDALFLYTIRAVFPDLAEVPVKELRQRKEELLFRFKESGLFLEDAHAGMIPKGTTTAQKRQLLQGSQNDLIQRITPYKNSKIILLSALVYNTLAEVLRQASFDVVNTEMIPFPGSGQQTKFKEGIQKLNIFPLE